MSAAREVQIADALVAELNAPPRPWHGQLTAQRVWETDYRAEDLADLLVTVVPTTIGEEDQARGSDRYRYTLEVGIQQRVTRGDRTRMDELALLAQTIHEWFARTHEIENMPDWWVLSAQRPEAFAPELLYAEQVWATVVVVEVAGDVSCS